METESNLIG